MIAVQRLLVRRPFPAAANSRSGFFSMSSTRFGIICRRSIRCGPLWIYWTRRRQRSFFRLGQDRRIAHSFPSLRRAPAVNEIAVNWIRRVYLLRRFAEAVEDGHQFTLTRGPRRIHVRTRDRAARFRGIVECHNAASSSCDMSGLVVRCYAALVFCFCSSSNSPYFFH